MILAVSGSLRQSSLNSAALRAAARAAARRGIGVQFDDSVRNLPHFDPDLEAAPPQSVQRFRAACARAEAVLFAVPEYAFGIPGAFKNALDWTVGSGSLYRKPVAVLSVAPPGRGANVRKALGFVLAALDSNVSWHHVPIDPSLLDDSEIRDARVAGELASVLEALALRRRTRSDNAQSALSGRRHTFIVNSKDERRRPTMAIATPALEGTYELDRTHSTVQFAVSHVGVSTFRGSFADVEASFVAEGDAAFLVANAVVDSISIGDPPEFREHVVRGSDFFAADEHPQISFHSTAIDIADDGTSTVNGVLEIRGVERPVHAVGTLRAPTEDPFGNTRIGFAIKAVIDRRNWNMDWQMPLPAGGDALGWEVEITAQLEFTKRR